LGARPTATAMGANLVPHAASACNVSALSGRSAWLAAARLLPPHSGSWRSQCSREAGLELEATYCYTSVQQSRMKARRQSTARRPQGAPPGALSLILISPGGLWAQPPCKYDEPSFMHRLGPATARHIKCMKRRLPGCRRAVFAAALGALAEQNVGSERHTAAR
jgi:hypothetical protein